MLWFVVGGLTVIGVAIVVRRALALTVPAPNGLDAGFARHRLLTAVHIAPGLLFVLLGPWQFMPALRARGRALHRWIGRAYLASGLIIGATALVMTSLMAIGGVSERAAILFFDALFLLALARGYTHIRRRDFARHREWMIRAYAIGIAVTTIRPIVGLFFATSRLTGLTPHDFFGAAFWIGFTLHLVAAEAWIASTRPVAAIRPSARD